MFVSSCSESDLTSVSYYYLKTIPIVNTNKKSERVTLISLVVNFMAKLFFIATKTPSHKKRITKSLVSLCLGGKYFLVPDIPG